VKRSVRANLSRTVSGTLGWLASRSPRIAFFVADALGAFLALIMRRPSWAVRRRIWKNHVRTQLLEGWTDRDGMAPLRMLVRPNDAIAQLQPPLIIGTFHVGPTYGLGVLSERLNGETFVLRGPMGATDQQRAATFHRAIERLRSNGFVIVALDPNEAQRIAAPFFEGTLQLARGPFAMSRVARVPIVPVVARWDGDAIELIVGEALPVSDDEKAIAEAAARWLESYLREQPGELSYRVLELTERRRLAG